MNQLNKNMKINLIWFRQDIWIDFDKLIEQTKIQHF